MIQKRYMSVFFLVLAALAFVILANCGPGKPSAVGEGPSWPRWRGPNGDGISQETGWNPQALAGGLRVVWQAAVGIGYSNVVLRGDLAILAAELRGPPVNAHD